MPTMDSNDATPMNVLVLNSGSASLRFQLIESDGRESDRCLALGLVERIGGHAVTTTRIGDGPKEVRNAPIRDHRAAVDSIIRWVISNEAEIASVRSVIRP